MNKKRLTKAQKKAARALIDLALERECANFIENVSKLSGKPLDDLDKPNHARYVEIFKLVDSFDKHIADRYDGMSGSRYVDTVSFLFFEGSLAEEDLEICDEELRDEVCRIKRVLEEINRR